MTLLIGDRFRGPVAALLAGLVLFLGARPVRAADADKQNPTPQAADSDGASESAAEKPPADPSAADVPAVPRLQIQDEGPSIRSSDSDRLRRARLAAEEDDERPFWKNWIFWTVTGVLVVGAVSMAVYMSSGTDASLAPCPPDVVVSLGCFGAGRQQ